MSGGILAIALKVEENLKGRPKLGASYTPTPVLEGAGKTNRPRRFIDAWAVPDSFCGEKDNDINR